MNSPCLLEFAISPLFSRVLSVELEVPINSLCSREQKAVRLRQLERDPIQSGVGVRARLGLERVTGLLGLPARIGMSCGISFRFRVFVILKVFDLYF